MVTITLPDENGHFPLWHPADVDVFGGSGSRADGSDKFISVKIAQVAVEASLPLRAADFDQQDRTNAHQALSDFNAQAERIAQADMRDFLDWARAETGLTTLGLSGAIPFQPHQAVFHDVDADRRLPMGFITSIVRSIPPDMTLSPELMTRIEARLRAGEAPSLAQSLLSDARSLQLGDARLDLARGVLAAAMACEVEVKRVLTELCRPESRALLDIVLERPREVTLQAASLFDSAASAVVGRSLRQENRDLYKKVVRLFEIRNSIAHRGNIPAEAEARDAIASAGEAMKWLWTLFNSSANSD